MSISPEGRAMRGSGLKSTKLRVMWGILDIVRYRMRSESEVEFSMLDLLFTAPVEKHTRSGLKLQEVTFIKMYFFDSAVNRMKKIKQINHILKQ